MTRWFPRVLRHKKTNRHLQFEPLEERCQPALVVPAGFGNLPLSFEANQGQFGAGIDYVARGTGYSVALSGGAAQVRLQSDSGAATLLSMSFPGANPTPTATPLDLQAAKTHYLLGGDPSQWHAQVANFSKVEYHDVFPGIDLLYYGNGQQLEFDFVVAPGADPSIITMAFQGADGMTLDGHGNLVLHTAGGDVIEQAPRIYQQNGATQQSIPGRFVLEGNNQVGFVVGAYDPSRPLTIDPVLKYSSYIGGDTSDEVTCVTTDAAGNIFLGGKLNDSTFPGVTGMVPIHGQGFVVAMTPDGTQLLYTTILLTDFDGVTGIAVDASDNVYVTGTTDVTSGFATAGAVQTTFGGLEDAFAVKVHAGGASLDYATYLGGQFLDSGHAIAVNANGEAIVTGYTESGDFPTQNPLSGQSALHPNSGHDAFVVKLSANGSQRLFSTYLGGNQNGSGDGAGATITEANAIALDKAGNIYLTGTTEAADFPTMNAFQAAKGYAQDVFITELKADGSQILYSTFLSGSGQTVGSGNGVDIGRGIAVDHAGNILVTGSTTSLHFPVKKAFSAKLDRGSPALADAFVTKLNPSKIGADQLVYSTYDGGSAIDEGLAIAVDAAGNAYITGHTNSDTLLGKFPVVKPIQKKKFPGSAFVAGFSPTGAIKFNSYYGTGGTGEGITVSGFGSVIFVGNANTTTLNTTSNAYQPDFPGATNNGFLAILSGSRKSFKGVDADGDLYSVTLTGPGAINVVQNDPSGIGVGPIAHIYLAGTRSTKSVLTISVTKKVGDGFVNVDSIDGTGLKKLVAVTANLTGGGISLTDRLGALTIHDVLNGADINVADLATQATRIKANLIDNGTSINVGGNLSLLKAASVGSVNVQANHLTTLSVAGDFAGSILLSGTGAALRTATIGGTVSSANIEAHFGSITSFTAGAFINSTLTLGQGANLTPNQKLSVFTIKGITGSPNPAFAGSNVSAWTIGTVSIASVPTTTGGTNFGITAHISIGKVHVANPLFNYNPQLPTPQFANDFEVQIG